MNYKDYMFDGKFVAELVAFLEKHWHVDSIRPKGFNELKKGYTDYDGMQEFCDDPGFEDLAKELEETLKVQRTGGSLDTLSNLSTPYVVYDDVCQGRAPLFKLICTLVYFGVDLGMKVQEEESAKEIVRLKEDVKFARECLTSYRESHQKEKRS